MFGQGAANYKELKYTRTKNYENFIVVAANNRVFMVYLNHACLIEQSLYNKYVVGWDRHCPVTSRSMEVLVTWQERVANNETGPVLTPDIDL